MAVATTIRMRMLELLSDGLPHSTEELFVYLEDEMGERRTVHMHLTLARNYLKVKGEQDILTQRMIGKCYYRLINLPPLPSK